MLAVALSWLLIVVMVVVFCVDAFSGRRRRRY